MPTSPHVETHFTATETVRDIVIGMSDGLTVPFALAAGFSGAAASTSIVVTAGLALCPANNDYVGFSSQWLIIMVRRGTSNTLNSQTNAGCPGRWSWPIKHGDTSARRSRQLGRVWCGSAKPCVHVFTLAGRFRVRYDFLSHRP